MSKAYASAITSVLGSSAMDSQGRGGTFSTDQIPAILAKLLPGFTEEQFKNAIDGKSQNSTSYDANGFPHFQVDEDLRKRLETKLIVSILGFDLN